MTPAEILRAAADLIEPEGKWCAGADAKTLDGIGVSTLDPRAHSFDGRNAVAIVCFRHPETFNLIDSFKDATQLLVEEAGGVSVGNGVDLRAWNDSHSQAEVVAALRSAADKWEADNGGGK